MELHEFHVTHQGSGSESNRVTIPRRNTRIGRFAEHLTTSASAKDRLLGPDQHWSSLLNRNDRTAASIVVSQQVDRVSLLANLDIR